MIQKLKNIYHLLQAITACILYGFPSRNLKVIGVTGTDGKTTTTHLIYHILTQSGKKTSMVSTVYAKVGAKVYDTGLHTTTPSTFLTQKLLKKAVDEHDEYFVLETTSHAIDQNRIWGIEYEVSIITNVTHEHLDYHKNFDEYLRTKAQLLLRSKKAIINRDDDSYPMLAQLPRTLTYGFKHTANYAFNFKKQFRNITDYDNYNYLAAFAVCRELGIAEKEIIAALKTFELPVGRHETVYDKKFKVIVDFAHTPNAFEKLLPDVKHEIEKGKLIHVFGAAGLRDHSKRPLMGEASGKYADFTIITEEDYRTEDPSLIATEVAEGIKKEGGKYEIVLDRESAIKHALEVAQAGDVILITGKGHEKSLCRGTVEYPWSDQETVRKLVKERS